MSSLAGTFLVARPVLEDPNFTRTVVLILQHGPEGAFGLVLNRPAKLKGFPFPAYTGGPCKSEGMLLLHGHRDWIEATDEVNEVAPGIFLGDASCLTRVKDTLPDQSLRYRFFTGYSGWAADQLEGEIAVGAWLVTSANGQLLFDTPADELWDRLSPTTIPQPSVN